MANLLLSVMGAFAEFERALIKERQREGIALAKKRGAYRGRRRSLSEEQVAQLPPTSRPGCREDDAGPRTQNQPRDRVPVPAHHTR